MHEPVTQALRNISEYVLPTIEEKLSEDEQSAAADAYHLYLEERYLEFFEGVLRRCGEAGVSRGTDVIAQEEKEYWGGLRPGGVKRCLLPSDEYIAFCEKSQSLFEQAILASHSGVKLCFDDVYQANLEWLDAQIGLLSGEERAWAEDTAEEMRADLAFIFGRAPEMSFRLCRFLATGTRKRFS